jgi:hypothetical protein
LLPSVDRWAGVPFALSGLCVRPRGISWHGRRQVCGVAIELGDEHSVSGIPLRKGPMVGRPTSAPGLARTHLCRTSPALSERQLGRMASAVC